MVVWSYGRKNPFIRLTPVTQSLSTCRGYCMNPMRESQKKEKPPSVCVSVLRLCLAAFGYVRRTIPFLLYMTGGRGGLFSSVCAPLNQMAYGKPSSGVAQQRRRRQSMAKSYILSHTPCANDANRTLPSKRKQTPVSIVRDSLRVIARVCVCARLISLRLRFSSFGMAVVLCCTYGLVALWCIMLPFRRRE